MCARYRTILLMTEGILDLFIQVMASDKGTFPPYLFILCAEGLSVLMSRYEQKQWIQGIKVCKKVPIISHMLFADDIYLYCKVEEEQVGYIIQLLQVFKGASGQKLNLEKSVVFLVRTPESKRKYSCVNY